MQLENWTWEDGDDTAALQDAKKQPTVQLQVPPGQTDMAVRLISGMYQKAPQLSDLSQQQLIELLLLADRFGVPKVLTAVLELFKAVAVNELQWDTAVALLDLPDSCALQEEWKPVCDLAVSKLLQQLGDLEQVWSDKQLQEMLLALPHAALLQLLQHNSTKVDSEATVVYTIEKWWSKQQRPSHKVNQLQQLMQRVRMQHLSRMYILTTLMKNSMVTPQCFSAAELGIASLCTTADSLQALQAADVEELSKYPAWTATKRPASGRQAIEWKLPLADLKYAVKQHLANGGATQTVYSQHHTVQGHKARLQLDVTKSALARSDAYRTRLGLYMGITDLPAGGICLMTTRLLLKSTGEHAASVRSLVNTVCNGGYWGGCFVNLGCLDCPADAEVALRQQGWVQGDGCLHIAAEGIQLQ
eukprot:GHUV01019028.1.p1 GENE.GHUV01019028.1~~GHUV01019028.1.p1  ORF type:complete len:416 (+),score=156.88 GHUV01019028.1:497-1744(+)